MRPLWNGTITFGLVVIPVRLYAATERKNVSFRLLHKECSTPVRYMKWCPNCERDLRQDEIVKAYEYQKGEHVVITEEDMEAIPGPSAHVIEILDFVSLNDVDPVYYEKSFFLEPREGAEKAYSLLFGAMRDQGKVALAKVAIRAKETLAIVRTYRDKFILLETMFWADEVRSGDELRIPEEAEIGDREFSMAKTLIETLSAEFEPAKYRSRQREAVSELIQKKIQGREVVRQPQAGAQVIDLMEALRRSVEKAKSEKTPATGEAVKKPRRRRKVLGEDVESAAPPPP
jgi:DNA end-binding protein Ku